MTNIIKKIEKLFRKSEGTTKHGMHESRNSRPLASASDDSMKTILTENIVKELMRQVEETKEGMYSCSDTFDLLDEYAELISSKQDAAKLMPLVKAHLDACGDCHQKYEVLLNILGTEKFENE